LPVDVIRVGNNNTLEGKLGYLARNKENHDLAGQLSVPWAVREWAAWFFVSELMRRHPNVFTPVPRFTMQKELIDMETTSAPGALMIRVNRTGSITIWGERQHPENCPVEENTSPNESQQIHLLDVYLAENPRDIIKELELCAGLVPPGETPLTGQATIGPRVIAELVRSRLHTQRPIVPVGVFKSNEYGDSIDQDMLRGLDGLKDLAELQYSPDWHSIFEYPVPLYSGLYGIVEAQNASSGNASEEKKLLFVIDIKKGLMHSTQKTVDLLNIYRRNDGDIAATAFSLLT
jgi:hypothetical protein